ncbi:MAG: hypothetical protein Q9186_006743 [Xanthomendoza sp. 1 TL-2023]
MNAVIPAILLPLRLKKWQWRDGQEMEFEDRGETGCLLTPGGEKRPDGSICIKGADMPFIVLEVANSQSPKKLRQKIHDWTEKSRHSVEIIVAIQIMQATNVALAHIIKTRVRKEEDGEDIIEQDRVLDQVVLYPDRPTAAFTIRKAEVVPKRRLQDIDDLEDEVIIQLSEWQATAMSAIDKVSKTSSPRDPKQRTVPSP